MFLLTLAAATIAAQSPNDDLSFERMNDLQKNMPHVCSTTMKLTPPGGSYGDTLYLYTGAETFAEKLFVLVVCKNYIKGLAGHSE